MPIFGSDGPALVFVVNGVEARKQYRRENQVEDPSDVEVMDFIEDVVDRTISVTGRGLEPRADTGQTGQITVEDDTFGDDGSVGGVRVENTDFLVRINVGGMTVPRLDTIREQVRDESGLQITGDWVGKF